MSVKEGKEVVSQSISVYLGALSILVGSCIPFIGLPLGIVGIIAFFLESKDKANRKSGLKICIVGTFISSMILYILYSGGAFGSVVMS